MTPSLPKEILNATNVAGDTPLNLAISGGAFDVAAKLIRAGVDLDILDAGKFGVKEVKDARGGG